MDNFSLNRKYNKYILGIIFVLSMYIVITSIYIKISSGILIVSSPKGSSISVQRQGYSSAYFVNNNINTHLNPGSYIIIATKGTNQVSKKVDIIKTKTSKLEFTFSEISKPDYSEANTLIKMLPYNSLDRDFSVTFKYKFENDISVPIIAIIPYTPNGGQNALNWIAKQGFNLKKLNIEILNPINSQNGQ
jgi:hypothetical protein